MNLKTKKMECKLIETAAFDELKSIVNRLHTQATRLAVHTTPGTPNGWLPQEELCRILHVTKRALQYLRQQRKIPYTRLGNKIFFREADIKRMLKLNLIKPKQ